MTERPPADEVSRASRIPVSLPGGGYPVLVGDGLLHRLADVLVEQGLDLAGRRALIVSQQPVEQAGHLTPVEAALRAAGAEVDRVLVDDGEAAKDVTVLAELWQHAAELPLTRRDLVVAVGGGVVGDLAGFLAATYARGVAVVQVPTTLLSQVDAAIGGKTGINLPQGKNLVGAFHQPALVVCDVAALRTLPRRLLIEGAGEVVKYGLLADPSILDDLERDGLADDLLRSLTERSVAVKARIVASDEREGEGGQRAWLNLGHTLGHVVEAWSGYGTVLHGEAVAIGTVAALRLGERLGHTPSSLVQRGEALLGSLDLPTAMPPIGRDELWVMLARDKKAAGTAVRFVVLRALADPIVVTPPRELVDEVVASMR